MKVGFLGGSFDPIHPGHLQLGRAALQQLRLDRLYFVLSPRSPFKKKKRKPVHHRQQWVQYAIEGEGKFRVGLWEVSRSGPSYTVDTLRGYHKNHPSHRLFLIVGSDLLSGLDRWKSPAELAALATLAVGRRPGSGRLAVPPLFRPRCRLLRGTFPDYSSTVVRTKLRAGRLSEHRLFHSVCVGILASQLAIRNGRSELTAYQAGLLHDIAKEWGPDRLIRYVKTNRLRVPRLDFILDHAPNILHAYAGAHWVRRRKWVRDPKWLKAIASHTLGNLSMSVEDKILFTSDFSSYDRDFSSAGRIRRLAFQNLDRGFRRAVATKHYYQRIHHRRTHPLGLRVEARYPIRKGR